MSNPAGKTAPRFTRLHKAEALRVVEEHFGVVNEACLDEIQKRIGRRPTRQAVTHWINPDRPKKNRKEVPSPVDSLPAQTPISATSVSDGNETATLQQAIAAAQHIDARSTNEELHIVLKALIAIPREQIDKLPPKERLRAFPALSDAWLRRLDISDGIIAALPALREMEAFIDRVKVKDGWKDDATLLAEIEAYNKVLQKFEAHHDKFHSLEVEDMTDADLSELKEYHEPPQEYFAVKVEIDRRAGLVDDDNILEVEELAASEEKQVIRSDNSAYQQHTPLFCCAGRLSRKNEGMGQARMALVISSCESHWRMRRLM